MEEEMVTITKKEYDGLYYDSVKLSFLMNAGVDNWFWYDDAMEEFDKWMEEE